MLDPQGLGIIDEELGAGSGYHMRRRGASRPSSSSTTHVPITHTHDVRRRQTSSGGGWGGGGGGGGGTREKDRPRQKKDKRFLREVQDELEEQRAEWKDEVDRLMTSTVSTPGSGHDVSFSSDPGSPNSASSNSYVDTSTGTPVFKAFVDVKDFPASGISVTVDKVANKVVVQARKPGPMDGSLTRTFTQKVQLPRYADDQMVRSKLGRDGVLTLEVPLMFYFPQEKKSSRSFINQVKTRPDGSKLLEILVNVGQEINPTDLRVRVNSDNELLIMAERRAPISGAPFTPTSKLIKRYILPRNADTRNVSSRLGNDGRLVVIVPLFKDNTMLY